MEAIIIFEDEFLSSHHSDLILMSRYVSVTKVNPSKVRYWDHKYFNKLFKRFRNNVDTWYDLCHHIKKVFANDFFILYIIVRNNTLNQFAFWGFFIEPSGYARHNGTVYKGYLSASSKLISRLALIDNDNNFSMIFLFASVSYFVIFFQSNFIFGRFKWRYFISFNSLMKWRIFTKDSLLSKFICLNFPIIPNIKEILNASKTLITFRKCCSEEATSAGRRGLYGLLFGSSPAKFKSSLDSVSPDEDDSCTTLIRSHYFLQTLWFHLKRIVYWIHIP